MTGQELYAAQRELAAESFGIDLPPWEELTPWRQANWNTTAADWVAKRLEDECESSD